MTLMLSPHAPGSRRTADLSGAHTLLMGCFDEDGLVRTIRGPRPRVYSTKVIGYRSGTCRNAAAYELRRASHTYAMMADGELWPMCGFGWNRSGGESFSIFRGAPGTEGDCKVCRRNVAEGRPPLMDGFPHRTRWL